MNPETNVTDYFTLLLLHIVQEEGWILASSGSSLLLPQKSKDVLVRFGLVEARLMDLRGRVGG
jgi:hypothetical protein